MTDRNPFQVVLPSNSGYYTGSSSRVSSVSRWESNASDPNCPICSFRKQPLKLNLVLWSDLLHLFSQLSAVTPDPIHCRVMALQGDRNFVVDLLQAAEELTITMSEECMKDFVPCNIECAARFKDNNEQMSHILSLAHPDLFIPFVLHNWTLDLDAKDVSVPHSLTITPFIRAIVNYSSSIRSVSMFLYVQPFGEEAQDQVEAKADALIQSFDIGLRVLGHRALNSAFEAWEWGEANGPILNWN